MRRDSMWTVLSSMLVPMVVVAVLAGSSAYAQDKKDQPAGPAKASAKQSGDKEGNIARVQLPAYYKGVVDEKQRDAIYAIQTEYTPKLAALKAQLDAMTKERDGKVAAVLTPEQLKKVEQLKAEAKAKRGPPETAKPTSVEPKPAEKKP